MASKTPAFEIIGAEALTTGAVLDTLRFTEGEGLSGAKWTAELTSLVPGHVPADLSSGIYLVEEYKLPYLVERLGKLHRVAAKLGCEAPTCFAIGWASRKVSRRDGIDAVREVTLRRVIISVTGTAPKLSEDWAFVATIEHTFLEGEWLNILFTSPSWEGGDLPKKFRTDGPSCDHCGKHVRRNNTYVLFNEDRGFVRVGSTCIRDFLGHVNPSHIASLAAFVREIAGCLEDDEGGGWGGRVTEMTGVVDMVAAVTVAAEEDGWLSRGKARDSEYDATADIAWRQEMIRKGYAERAKGESAPPVITEDHLTFARDAVAWARDIEPDTDSDYLHNLRVSCMGAYVVLETAGIVGSAYIAYRNDLEREAKRSELDKVRGGSRHFATKGDKIGRKLTAKNKRDGCTAYAAMDVELVSSFQIQTDFGISTIMEFLVLEGEQQGCVLKWFCSSPDSSLVGSRFSLAATVKGRDEYKGNLQTLINRAVLTPLEA